MLVYVDLLKHRVAERTGSRRMAIAVFGYKRLMLADNDRHMILI
jgi:hypothetical protein